MISFGGKPSEVDKENEEMPDYPSDEESPIKVNGNEMARVKGSKHDGGEGWGFGFVRTVGSFINSSFYW